MSASSEAVIRADKAVRAPKGFMRTGLRSDGPSPRRSGSVHADGREESFLFIRVLTVFNQRS
jgi:hypothetical protein